MSFTEGDRAIIRQTAWEIGDVISQRLEKAFKEHCRLTQATCPVKDIVEAAANQGKGATRVFAIVAALLAAAASVAGVVSVLFLRK